MFCAARNSKSVRDLIEIPRRGHRAHFSYAGITNAGGEADRKVNYLLGSLIA